MTIVAVFASLTEAEARAKAEDIGSHPLFDGQAIDLNEAGPGDWSLLVYFEAAPTGAMKAALAARAGRKPRFVPLADADWVKKSLAGLKPVRAARFVVHGRHDRATVRANDIGIEIEAGQAFGTGHHGTTSGCLAAIERVARRRRIPNALDLGTGSGVLAIAIARRTHAPVTASDIDPVAVKVAEENVRLNGVRGRVRMVTAAGFANRMIRAGAPYDLIVANILAGPLMTLAPAIRRALAPGGTVILSGLLATQRRAVAAAYRRQGLPVAHAIPIGEWLTLTLEAPRG